ncbi:MAG: response regulator [Gemmatimonadota bacterium]
MARAPLVLIVSQHEWASRSLDSVIAPRGYAVLRAYNGEQALARAHLNDPDAVFVDMELPDMSGAELTRKLLEHEAVSRAAPVLIIAAGHVSREQKLEALEAGGWEILSLPVDAEELLLRIEHYIRGKLESDRLKEDALIDTLTGLYSWHGISRRISELAAAAERYGRPLSCVVVTVGQAEGETEADPLPAALTQLAEQLRSTVRTSDVLARIGPREFAVVAPDTPPDGAKILATRLREMSKRPGSPGPIQAGVCAVDNLQEAGVAPLDLLLRATRATERNRTN